MPKKLIVKVDANWDSLSVIARKLNEIIEAVNGRLQVEERLSPTLEGGSEHDEKVMTALEQQAQHVVDYVAATIDDVRDTEVLASQDIKFFNRCLGGKLTDMLDERGML